jgi:ElaB/YqjD/DUF883 family membrane-anchored ribosome-binding protein
MPQIIDLDTGKLKPVESVEVAASQPSNQEERKPSIIPLDMPEPKTNKDPYAFDTTSPEFKRNIEDALTPLPAPDLEGVSNTSAFLMGLERGRKDFLRGVGEDLPESRSERQRLDAINKEFPISSTVGRVSGQAMPFLAPGTIGAKMTAGAGLPTRVAMGAGLGATEGNVIAEGMGASEDEKRLTTSIGGLIGGSAEVAFPLLGRLGNATIGKWLKRKPTSPVIDKMGNPSKELVDALDKAGLSFDEFLEDAEKQLTNLPSDQKNLIRRKALSDAGVTSPTKAQLTGDAGDFQTQQELLKVSGPVRATIENQDRQLYNSFDNAVNEVGQPSSNFSYNPVTNFVVDKSLELDQAITSAYKSARQSTNNSKVISTDRMVDKLRGMAGAETASGGVYSAVKGFLKEKGLITGKKLKVNGLIDADAAEALRIDINSLYDSVSPLGKSQLKDLKNALDEDVMQFAGEDAFKAARSMKAKFERELTRTKNNKFDKRSKEFLRDILENKYNPDTFFNDAIISKTTRSSDLGQLKKYLDDANTPESTEAWNNVRAVAAEYITDNAFNEVGGVLQLSRAKLQKTLNKVGKDKMKVLFSNDENKFFDLMMQVSKIREPSAGTQQGLGPSAQAIKAFYSNVTNNSVWYDVFKAIKLNKVNEEMLVTIDPPVTPLKQEARATGVAAATGYILQPEETEEQD